MSPDRDIDIVVFGATGFVGKLTAEYLARHAPEAVSVGLGGRSEDKLERTRSSLGARAADWPLVVADSSDAESMKAMAERCRVVATTVGPYRKYGMPLVEACAEAGSDYLDLTGEPLFIRDAIDRCHARAQESGARIVHCCGFDSIPSDIGVYLLYERAKADGAGELEDTTYVVRGLKGGPSGGTIESMKGMIDEAKADSAARRLLGDPYALSPDRAAEPDLGDESDVRMPVEDKAVGEWLGPFVMAAVNARVVRRSNALQEWAYGRRFRYRETMGMGAGLAGRAKATALSGGLGAVVGAMSFGPTRAVVDRFLPKPGEGPSAEARAKGFFKTNIHKRTSSAVLYVFLPKPGEGPSAEARAKGFFKIDIHTRTSSGARYVCRVAAQGDPGYAGTAVMLGESALCLVENRDRLPDRAGILTPATAFDGVLPERLRAAGMTLEVRAA